MKIQWSISPSERCWSLIVPVPGITGFEMSQQTTPYSMGNEKMSSMSLSDPASGKWVRPSSPVFF